MRPFEQQSALERTLRSHLYTPNDVIDRAEKNTPGLLRKKEYAEAARLQSAASKAKLEVKDWENLINLYERELGSQRRLLERCLDTGALRTDETRDLYLEICKQLGIEPYTYANSHRNDR